MWTENICFIISSYIFTIYTVNIIPYQSHQVCISFGNHIYQCFLLGWIFSPQTDCEGNFCMFGSHVLTEYILPMFNGRGGNYISQLF